MGEGAAIFLLKRLADAERDRDKIYAVLRGIGGSSDGKGKGITAPNPIGQKLCIERAWENAGLSPATVSLIEGHGTSTRVGDVVEVESMSEVLRGLEVRPGSVGLGSVKSNIGHLKGAAGAAGILKAALALRDNVLPPSVHCEHPNPDIDFSSSALYVNTKLQPWTASADCPRRAGVSAFGFGGTNFHAVLEEYIPHRLNGHGKRSVAVRGMDASEVSDGAKAPLRGALLLGAASEGALVDRLRAVQRAAAEGRAPAPSAPNDADLRAPERIAIDYGDAAELSDKAAKALNAFEANRPITWKALRAQGIFRGHGAPPKVAFLFPGQGSQYVNMLQHLRASEPIVKATFAEADQALLTLLGKPLSEFIFVDNADPKAVAKAEDDLRQTAITQPAVLASDIALTRLLAAYGIRPDFTMGHSLGEYGALVASGGIPFEDALEAVSARGREMTRVAMADNGRMAAVFAPLPEIERILKTVPGYTVIANINSSQQAVIGGASAAVEKAMEAFQNAGYNAIALPVSHAFHTSIVAPASEPLRRTLERLRLQPPAVPIVANVDGAFYPTGADAASKMLDVLARQIASPVQFVKGLHTVYEAGARVFVEVGPKKALQGFAEDVLGDRPDVVSLFTNHPKFGDVVAFNQALCGLYAAGVGKAFRPAVALPRGAEGAVAPTPVLITGAALGLPGAHHVFDDDNVARILKGEQFIDVIPTRFRRAMLDKHITRLVKSDNGGPTFETIGNVADVIKLAARGGAFDLETEFGISPERNSALDRVTRLAIGAGLDALRDAGIPLVMHYKTTSKGTRLPDRWRLPESMRDDTGVIFASAFPGLDSLAHEVSRYEIDRARREQLAVLESLRARLNGSDNHSALARDLDRRIDELRREIERDPYTFDRRFLFRILSMGHSQFAEFIGARGPNTQVNAACASCTQAVAVAEDWIRAGRCRRVIIVSADDITSDHLIEWFGSGFLATGAAATDDIVEEAAIPFDRRRHGMIIGMGAAALVVESAEAVRERGLRPICEVLSAVTANSAFHGTRLDVNHISQVMETLVAQAEKRHGIRRQEIAPRCLFVSHETYTPARGGSASAEIHALRHVFGEAAGQIVIANTKGFTGHAMGAGVEDVVAVKALETGIAPPVANFKEVDPELGPLNLSQGGLYPIEYALRLGAGFGSQISMTLTRLAAASEEVRPSPHALGYAYRIAEPAAWKAWLDSLAAGELEVVQRTLLLRDHGTEGHAAKAGSPAEQVAAPLPAPPPVAPQPIVQADPVKERVLALVSEKTGYPVDMLDLDLDLEADLGVDTVKQAEVFATIREAYGIARDEKIKLRDFPTLAHVIRFVHEKTGGAAGPLPDSRGSATDLIPSRDRKGAVSDTIQEKVLEIVSQKTGYPKDMLDLDLDLEADLGVDTVKQAEVFATIREAYGITRDEKIKLRDFPTLAHVIRFVNEKTGSANSLVQSSLVQSSIVPSRDRQGAVGDPIQEKVLEIVSEKTGYPKDMLDLDLDLEADLGIDTVKQAETFASVRAAFGIPRDANLKLRDFPTLAHVIQFARDRSTQAGLVSAPVQPEQKREIPAASQPIPRRVPVPVLRPPLTMCKPTGVTLGSGRRVLIAPDRAGAGEALARKLTALGVEVLPWNEVPPEGTVHGVFWLPALDPEASLAEMNLEAWHEALRMRVKSLYAIMRDLYEQVAKPGTFFLSATRLGGQHGYDEAGAYAPLGGAVTGFTKTYKRECPDALVKTLDFEPQCTAEEIAQHLIDETLRDPGAVEIGYREGLRWTIGLEERPATSGEAGLQLGKDTVFLITGAAGSIVSAITADLAAASGGTFYLLDLAPAPPTDDPDLKRFRTDREALKRDLRDRLQAAGQRGTPAQVEKELADLERKQAARGAIDAVLAAGGTAHYFQVDLTDPKAVAAVVEKVRTQSGRIDVLLHAAGAERSHLLPDKDSREFDLVFNVKCDGWFNLFHAIGDMPVGAVVMFSSVAARFGNAGQSDYSSANDLLCKIASSFRTTRKQTRAIAVDWTGWKDIGMASRGSIPKMMEQAGIELLPSAAGVPWVRNELTARASSGEVVVALGLGILLEKWDADAGIDATATTRTPMVGSLHSEEGDTAIETPLDPAVQPFLHDHQINGTPVLPGVMGLEAFAEAALSLLPGWRIDALEDVNFLAPFKFYRSEPRVVTVQAAFHAAAGEFVADCRLTGRRPLAKQTESQVTTHFTARVRLTKQDSQTTVVSPPGAAAGAIVDSDAIYRVYFHGPAYQVLERVWRDGSRMIGEMKQGLPDDHHPAGLPMSLAPRLIELCFQTAGLWEIGAQHRMGLPRSITRISFDRAPDRPEGPFYAVVTPAPDGESFDAQVIDRAGNRYLNMNGYRMIEMPDTVDAEPVEALEAVLV
jgi:malonyl CoA-acyl carrier protein transacylase